MSSTGETYCFPTVLAADEKGEKKKSVLLLSFSHQKLKGGRRRTRRTNTGSLKKMCFHFNLLLCVILGQSRQSNKILFVLEQELLLLE